MAGGLRILIAEDSPTDAELINYALHSDGLVYDSVRVQTKEMFVKAIREFKPDIIISDYEMPGFNGSSARALARVECHDVPFILLSGAVSETFADEMIKSGATDYVSKRVLSRLAPAVKRAITNMHLEAATSSIKKAYVSR